MRRDWIFGLGAISTLTVLVVLDLFVALVEDRSLTASHALLRGLRPAGSGVWASPLPRPAPPVPT